MADPNFLSPVTNPFGLADVGYNAAPTFVDIDGDGDLDAFVGDHYPGYYGYYFYGNINFFENTGDASTPSFAAPQTNPFGLVGSYASPTFVDIDGDGDFDAFVGEYSYNSPGNITFFENTGDASTPSFAAPQTNPFGLTNLGFNDTAPTFADLDGDGYLDALVGNSDGGVEFSQNIGNASTPMFDSPVRDPFGLSTPGVNSFPSFVDIDGDGDLDAFVGDFAGYTNFWRNTGDASNPNFSNLQPNPFGLTSVGSNAAPTFVDIDNDEDLDALVGNRDGNILFFENVIIAEDDTVSIDEDTVLSGNVLNDNGNGVDKGNGQILSVTEVNDVAANIGSQITLNSNALLTVNPDGTFDYDPNGQFEALNDGETGTDSFTYRITDSGGDTDTATVTVTINGVTDSIGSVTDYTIFSQQVNSKEFTVGLKDGDPVYQIDNIEILNQSVNAFLNEAVTELGGQTVRNGTINEGGLEHFGGTQNPSIREKDAVDDVIISGSGVGGQYKADFDNDTAAGEFVEFANDLLGRDPATPKFFQFNGSTNGGANSIQIFSNDEIIGLNPDLSNGLDTPDSLLFRWSGADTPGQPTTNYLDEFLEEMGTLFGGTQLQDVEIENDGLQNPGTLTGANLNQVDLLSGGVLNQEVYEFSNQQEAQNFLNFFDDVVDAFGEFTA